MKPEKATAQPNSQTLDRLIARLSEPEAVSGILLMGRHDGNSSPDADKRFRPADGLLGTSRTAADCHHMGR